MEDVVAELVALGAEAVVLVGSVARGDDLPTSDIDLVALGSGPAYALRIRESRQVSISWRTAGEVRASFHRPADCGGAVPAWRGAVVLADPSGEADRLRAEAHAWDWPVVAEAADAWVAEQISGYAEEVHRLVGQASAGSPRAAAAMRCVLALRMAFVLGVHHRILYDSENRLWDLVAVVEGPQWTLAQDRALGVVAATPQEGDRAALDLYAIAAARTAHLLDDVQSAVVRQALALI